MPTIRTPAMGEADILARDLSSLGEARAELRGLKDRVEVLEATEKQLETLILKRLDAGIEPPVGSPPVVIDVWTRRSIAWKQEFEKALGTVAVAQVMEAHPPTEYRDVLLGVEALIRRDLVTCLTDPRARRVVLEEVIQEGGTVAQVRKALLAWGHRQVGWAPAEIAVTVASVLQEMEDLLTRAATEAARKAVKLYTPKKSKRSR